MPKYAQKLTETQSMHARMMGSFGKPIKELLYTCMMDTQMTRPPLDRGYESPKTHQKGPEISLGIMQVKAPLKGLE